MTPPPVPTDTAAARVQALERVAAVARLVAFPAADWPREAQAGQLEVLRAALLQLDGVAL